MPDFLAELDAIDADARSALFSLSADQLARSARPDQWSALQCFEHLTLMNRIYIDQLTAIIDEATSRQQRSSASFRYTLLARLILRFVEPPPAIKVPIPTKSVAPSVTQDAESVRKDFEAQQRDLRQMIERAQRIDLRTMARNPFVPLVKMQLGSILGVILAHERRHLYQAKKAAGVFVA